MLDAARRREIDVVLVWRLDRWGRSVTDLLATLQELEHLGIGFISLTEALDLTTPAGRAMAGLLAIFAEFEREVLRDRTRTGLAQARQNGKRLGRQETAARHSVEVRKLYRVGLSKSEIARRLQIGRTDDPRGWLWRRIDDSRACRRILALGSIAEHGLLRLFESYNMKIRRRLAESPQPWRSKYGPNEPWAKNYAAEKKINWWLKQSDWWEIHTQEGEGTPRWRVLPISHPGDRKANYTVLRQVLNEMH